MPPAKKKENLSLTKDGELQKRLALLEENMRVIRFKAEGAKSKNVKELANMRKDVARILTEINKSKKK